MKISHAFLLCALAFAAAEIPQSFAQNPGDGRIDRVLHGLRPPVAIKGRPAVRWMMADRHVMRCSTLIPFWIMPPSNNGPLGFGVTAFSLNDAFHIIESAGYGLLTNCATRGIKSKTNR